MKDRLSPKGDARLTAKFRQEATNDLMLAIVLDVWPRQTTRAAFGIKTQEHLEAIYEPVRQGEITRQQLQDAAGDGRKITALVDAARSNPHPGLDFAPANDAPVPVPQKPARERTDREAVARDIFEAIAAIGFLNWKEENRLDYAAELAESTPELIREQYVRVFEKTAWAEIQEMAAQASIERLLDVRQEWIDQAEAMGLMDWKRAKEREAKRSTKAPDRDFEK